MAHPDRLPDHLDVLAVRYGTLATRKSAVFHDFVRYGEPDDEQVMDYFFWVVRGQGQTLLVDTGFAPEEGRRRGRTCLIPPREAFARLGLGGDTRVLVTHFHYDHIGNLDAFPDAELLVAEAEFRYWTADPEGSRRECAAIEPAEVRQVMAAHQAGRVRLLGDQTVLMPGVTTLTMGGHSPGQQVLLLETRNQSLILTSDAVHFYAELSRDRPFHVFTDLAEMRHSFTRLRSLAGERDAPLVPGHDPEVTARFPPASGGLGDMAHRLL